MANKRDFVVQVRSQDTGEYQIQAYARNDSDTNLTTPILPITEGIHAIEIDFQVATASGANNGRLTLWIDDVQAAQVTNVDNDTRLVDYVRLGFMYPNFTPTGTSVYLDDFVSGRSAYIGLAPNIPATRSEQMLTDGFEMGDFSRWGYAVTDGDDLSISTAAAMHGDYGMAALIDDTISIYVKDGEPVDEPRYRARFDFDPNSIDLPDGGEFAVLRGYNAAGDTDFTVSVRLISGVYQVKASMWSDSHAYAATSYFPITDSPHALEIDFQAASSTQANDGSLILWIDGTEVTPIQGIDNDTRTVDSVRLGVIDPPNVEIGGAVYIDDFVSDRTQYIGPN
jgi:hypothetical protein